MCKKMKTAKQAADKINNKLNLRVTMALETQGNIGKAKTG